MNFICETVTIIESNMFDVDWAKIYTSKVHFHSQISY